MMGHWHHYQEDEGKFVTVNVRRSRSAPQVLLRGNAYSERIGSRDTAEAKKRIKAI